MQFSWPNQTRGAVSLRFDDGLQSHLDVVVPMLEEYGLRGTFYVCPAGMEQQWRERATLWQPASCKGHEIGNHSLSHPIPAALADEPIDHCCEKLTLEAYQADVLEAQRRLASTFHQPHWTYCYPCYETDVGTGLHRQSVVPFIAEHFLAATSGGEISQPYNDPHACDLHKLLAIKADMCTADQLIHHIEQCMNKGRWAIAVYHGVGEGHLCVSKEQFAAVLAWLADKRNSIWSAPVGEIAAHVAHSRTL